MQIIAAHYIVNFLRGLATYVGEGDPLRRSRQSLFMLRDHAGDIWEVWFYPFYGGRLD
jgi:hypothetical protein